VGYRYGLIGEIGAEDRENDIKMHRKSLLAIPYAAIKDRIKANMYGTVSTYSCDDSGARSRGGIAANRANLRKTPYKIKNGSTVHMDFGRQAPARLRGLLELIQLMGKLKIRGRLGQRRPRNPCFCGGKWRKSRSGPGRSEAGMLEIHCELRGAKISPDMVRLGYH
jgi:hypothetical protein